VRLRLTLCAIGPFCALTAGAAGVRAGLRGASARRRLNVTGYELLATSTASDEWRCRRSPRSDVLGIEPEEVFEPLPERLNPNTAFTTSFSRPPSVMAGRRPGPFVIAIESNFNPKAVSPKNARGLMQLPAANRRAIGCAQCFRSAENIEGGTRYLKDMLARKQRLDAGARRL